MVSAELIAVVHGRLGANAPRRPHADVTQTLAETSIVVTIYYHKPYLLPILITGEFLSACGSRDKRARWGGDLLAAF